MDFQPVVVLKFLAAFFAHKYRLFHNGCADVFKYIVKGLCQI